MNYEGVANVYTAEQFRETEFRGRFASLLQQGWDPQRSGDLMIMLEPGYASYPPKGSTHGTAFNYDTHVPFLLYGKGVKPGFTNRRTAISDIAPTLCSMLGVAFPNGSVGDPVYEAIDR
jgi:predicted AlkP superfamily pyrophosphatase or phosphodiesterase